MPWHGASGRKQLTHRRADEAFRHSDVKDRSTPKVLVVSHEASRTGAPRVAIHLLQALRDGGFRTVVVSRWGGPLRKDLERAADRGRLEPLARLRVLLRRRSAMKPLAARIERWAIRRVLRQEQPDLVWCNTVLTAVYAPEAIARGIRCIVHNHERPELVRAALERAGLLGTGPAIGPTDLSSSVRYIGCSAESAQIITTTLGLEAGSVTTLHSPVDVTAIRSAGAGASVNESPRRVMAVGLGNLSKGVDVFGQAAERSSRSDVTWEWIGEVPDERSGAVQYLGQVAEVAARLATASVFVLSSRSDSFPLVVLEAMALGRPIVASRLPGTVEQLGEAALFVEPGDADALAASVERLLNDPELAARLGRAAAQRCERLWDTSTFAEGARQITHEVLDG